MQQRAASAQAGRDRGAEAIRPERRTNCRIGLAWHADEGRARIIFPTRRNLERLARFASFAAAAADARAHPIRTITPWTEHRDGRPHLCIDADLGYPITAEPVTAALRG